MIKLDVKEYCHACMDFSPDVIHARKEFADFTDEIVQTNTVVQCEYRRRCEAIKEYLERQAKVKTEAVG